jgi:ribosomal protein S18 acetylase RimI-like enzyme
MLQAPTIAALALWLAFNHPFGGYRESVAETLRRDGRAHLCVQTDADGLLWGFSVADRTVELRPDSRSGPQHRRGSLVPQPRKPGPN